MATSPFVIDRFGGLNLASDPKDVGANAATSLSNVAFDDLERIRTRDGYTQWITTSTVPTRVFTWTTTSTGPQVITSSSTKLEAFNAQTGASVATVAAIGPHQFVAAGTPSNPAVYTVSPFEATVRKWNGTAWSTVAAAPANGKTITYDPDSSRLVIAGHSGGDRVQWSEAGDPTTWPATNFVDLSPGDGQLITHATVWQGLVFVFKEGKHFVFYGESTDGDGNPIFNYRSVPNYGAQQGYATVLSTPQGVYFINARDGLRLATGGPQPALASADLAPLFGRTFNFNSLDCHLAWGMGRLVMVLDSSATNRVLVWYRDANAWSEWSLPIAPGFGGGFASQDAAFYFVDGTNAAVYRMIASSTTDAGSAIAWSYTSGLYSPANDRGRVAISLESQLLGSGTATLQVATTGGSGSSSGAFDTGSAVTLGTAPAIAEGWQQIDREGAQWQHKLSGSGVATIDGLTHYLSYVKPSGVW